MSKPKILMFADVVGWAWWIKAQELKKYLSDEFDIEIWAEGKKLARKKMTSNYFDIYLTFGYGYVDILDSVEKKRRISGITAHRDWSRVAPKMKKCGTVHANSIILLDKLKKMHDRCYYVPNGINEKLFRIIKPIPKERSDGNIVVGHIGKKNPKKGQEDFVIPSVIKSGARSLFHHVNHKKKIPHKEMVHLYQKIDCFIVASIEDGTPNPALEAAACGRPIISNRIGNMPEFIKDGYNGFLLDERNVDDYVDRILWFKKNRDKMIQMGLNARKTIEEDWTWKKLSENYRIMLRETLKYSKGE